MTTPRVFIIRHGETEWSLNGRHTGTSDIPLTANGERRIRATGGALVGPDRLIVPRNLAHVYVSPRRRARRTLELLNLGCTGPLPWSDLEGDGDDAGEKKDAQREGGKAERGQDKSQKVEGAEDKGERAASTTVEVADAIREWDYGEYEGVTSEEIAERRERDGQPKWDIWRDGCPGGESPQQVTARCDALIADIRRRFHAHAIGRPKGSVAEPFDVLVVAHGHILRAFAGRWIRNDIARNPSLILEAGGVGTLSYEHHSLDEPAILLGGAFMSDIVEDALQDKGSG